MKQDLLDSGAAQRSPALLYEIDKVRRGRADGRLDTGQAMRSAVCLHMYVAPRTKICGSALLGLIA